MADYDVGDVVTLGATMRDSVGVLADPVTITFRIQARNGPVTAYVFGTDAELERVSLGVYRVAWEIIASGPHDYRWIATGNDVDQEEPGEFYARPSNV